MSKVEVFSANQNILDNRIVGSHEFTSGICVPIVEIHSLEALNQTIGYIKYKNRNIGVVYYRGQCVLHKTMLPSIFHRITSIQARNAAQNKLNIITEKIVADSSLKIADNSIAEALLQHYGVNTRCIDVVDNHWIALWFGQHTHHQIWKKKSFCTYRKRSLSIQLRGEKDDDGSFSSDENFQYIILLCGSSLYTHAGTSRRPTDIVTIDLRTSVPSFYLRPHAQHGMVLKKCGVGGVEDYDLSSRVVGILKLRIDLVSQWLGSGQLLTQQNLFPSPAYDIGYYNLIAKESDLGVSMLQYTL